MRAAQNLFVDAAAYVAGAWPKAAPRPGTMAMPGPGGTGKPPKTGIDRAWIQKNPLIVWFVAVIGVLVLSALVIAVSLFVLAKVKFGIIAVVAIWAILIGWFFLFLAPAKLVTAAFGALFGSGTHAVVTGEGMINQLKKLSGTVIEALGVISPQVVAAEQGFITAMVWLFLGLVCLLCLPAFFRD